MPPAPTQRLSSAPSIEDSSARGLKRKIKSGLLHRSFTLTRGAVDREARTVELAFASEDTVVPRWFGGEVLDHSKGAVRLDRINDKGPLLMDHDGRRQVGVVDSAALDTDKISRAVVRFSRSAAAEEVFQDVLDDIRVHVSVGYRVHKMILDRSSDEEGDIYRVTDWEPYEISLVSVPADHTVGVGRAAPDHEQEYDIIIEAHRAASEETAMPQQTQDTPATPPAPAPLDVRAIENQTREREITRIRDLESAGQRYSDYGGVDLARESIRAGETLEQFRAKILDRLPRAGEAGSGEFKPDVKLSTREQQAYSLTRGIIAMSERAEGRTASCFELDVSQEIEKGLPGSVKRHGGLYVPYNLHVRAGLDSKTATTGQELKFTEPREFIQLLRNAMLVQSLGATVMSGLQGNIAFPKQNGAGTASWVAENPGADTGESNLTLTQVPMSPKILQSTTSYSRQLLAQGVVDVDNLVRSDLASITALEIDRAAINGSGASNQPTGLLAAAGVNLVAIGTNGGAPTYEHIIDMQTAIDDSNALADNIAYLTTPTMRGKLKKTQKFASTNGDPVWSNNEMDGYNARSTKQVPSSLTKGTSVDCHAILLGVWNNLMIGFWGPGYELVVDPYRLKKQGMIELTSYHMADIAFRYPQAFSKIVDARNV